MRRTICLTICLLLIASALTPAVLAKGHRFELVKKGLVNGVELKPGHYELVLIDESLGEIYRGKKRLVEVKVDVVPIGGATPGSVSQYRDGRVKEVRLENERVVFVNSDASAQTAR